MLLAFSHKKVDKNGIAGYNGVNIFFSSDSIPMSNFETFSQESSELKEIDWVKQQIKAELHSLQQDAFYRKDSDTGKVDYNLTTVKDYLQTLQGKDRATLTSKNSSARVMAVQIALESKGYDVGKIDGIFGMHTRQQVRAFQEANQLTVDGLPGKETIAKLIEVIDWTDTSKKAPDTSKKALESSHNLAKSYFLTPMLRAQAAQGPVIVPVHGGYMPLTPRLIQRQNGAQVYPTQIEAQLALKDILAMDKVEERKQFEEEKAKGTEYITFLKEEWIPELLKEYQTWSLDLSGLKDLSPAHAESLAKFQGEYLLLRGLTTLGEKQAESLAKLKGNLFLNGLTSLGEKQAESLAKLKGEVLCLDGLTSLNEKEAESLAKFKWKSLYLGGIVDLGVKEIANLAQFQWDALYLDGIIRLWEEQAANLAKSKAKYLYLNWIRTLWKQQAVSLSQFSWEDLAFLKIRSLSEEEAKALAKYQGALLVSDEFKDIVDKYRNS